MALQIQTAGAGVVRDSHFVIPTGATAPVRTLLTEPQRTNLCIRSEEFDTWTLINATVTANSTIAPNGAATADTIVATAAVGRATRNVTFTGNGEKCVSVYLKAGTSLTSLVAIQDGTAGVQRHRISVTWSAGVPTLTTASGSGTVYQPQLIGDGWYRIMLSAVGVIAANVNSITVIADSAGTGTVHAWGAQAEDAVVPSSYIPTAATTVTRNADSLYWEIPALVPQEMTVYHRSVNVGWASDTAFNALAFHIGTSGAFTDPRFNAGKTSVAGRYQATYDNASAAQSALVNTTAAALNDVVELRAVLSAAWAPTLGLSINNASELTNTAPASGPAAAFAAARIYLSGALSTENAAVATTHLAIARGTQTRATMRAIAGVP